MLFQLKAGRGCGGGLTRSRMGEAEEVLGGGGEGESCEGGQRARVGWQKLAYSLVGALRASFAAAYSSSSLEEPDTTRRIFRESILLKQIT